MYLCAISLVLFGSITLLIVFSGKRKYNKFLVYKKVLEQAEALVSLERHLEAVSILMSIYKQYYNQDLALLLIRALSGLKKIEDAFKEIAKGQKRYPKELRFYLEEAKLLLRRGNYSSALELFNKSVPILKNESDLFDYATACFKAGLPHKCSEILYPFLKYSADGEMFCLMADSLRVMGRHETSIYWYNKALELNFSNRQLLIGLGISLNKLGKIEEAGQVFRRLLQEDPNDVLAILGIGGGMEVIGLYRKALLFYRSSLVWKHGDVRLLRQAGLCAIKIKKFDCAERFFALILQKEGPLENSLIYYGYSLEAQGKWAKAEQAYLEVINRYPNSLEGNKALARMFGLGVSTKIEYNDSLRMAYLALSINNDPSCLEILSACEARGGNFLVAYKIQEKLLPYDSDVKSQERRQKMLLSLKNNEPIDNLDQEYVLSTLVA